MKSNNHINILHHLDNRFCDAFGGFTLYVFIFVILLVVFTANYFSALFCPDLNTTIANGKVECDRHFKRGSICRYSCHWGFELDPLGHEGKFCHKNGTWVGKKNPPKCICKIFTLFLKLFCNVVYPLFYI